MPIKLSSSKAKGRNLQQSVRDTILENFPELEPDDCKSTGMGQSGEDVQLSPSARKLLPVSIECKARKSIVIYSWYHQAKTNCKAGLEPVLVVKVDRKRPLVCVDAEYFFKVMAERNANAR
jgi:hypothetical protein